MLRLCVVLLCLSAIQLFLFVLSVFACVAGSLLCVFLSQSLPPFFRRAVLAGVCLVARWLLPWIEFNGWKQLSLLSENLCV